MQTKEDHPELTKLLKEDAKLGGDGDDPNDTNTSGRSALGNGSKSDRAGKANSKVPPSFKIQIPPDRLPKNPLSPPQSKSRKD